jgi:hypothetical protein
MTFGQLISPTRHFALETIEGRPDDIASAGRKYNRIGSQMEWTADELDKLAADEKYKAEGLDAIRESAGELAGELHKVAERYSKTGPVLVTYASALRRAQNVTVDPLVEPIRTAHAAAQDAADDLRRAQRAADDLDHTWPWEDEPTDADRRRASSDLSSARTAAGTAESSLEGLWESFETGYDEWETAYEAAVTGVENACEASGINDTWWEDLLDGLAQVATIVATIAVVLAIVLTGPIAAALLAIAAIASFVALAAHLTMMIAGSKRVSMTDIVFDLIGVVPFLGAFGKALKGGQGFLGSLRAASGLGGATRTTLSTGRNAVAYDLRSIAGAGGSYGGRAAREARAAGVADDFLRGIQNSWGRNTWNAIRQGGTQLDGQAATMAERLASAWPGGRAGSATRNWLSGVDGVGGLTQGTNVWNLGYGGYQSLQNLGVPLPDMPDFVPNPFGGR